MSADRKTFKRRMGECLFALAVGLLLTMMMEWAVGEDFMTRQQARAYAPIAGITYGDGSRDNIRVLLIDDAALAAAGQEWPARYSYSARLLRAVGQYQPKAVFVDIYYSARRDDDSLRSLLDQVCALHTQGTRVFMATARNRDQQYSLRPELEALAGRCFEKVAVSYTPDELDRLAWTYHLGTPGAGHGAAGLKSAALALYETSGKTVPVEHHAMALTWGSHSAAHGVDWVVNNPETGKPTSYCRNTLGLGELMPPGMRSSLYADGDKPICVFHETIRAGALASTTPEEDAHLRQLIAGKVVLIGTALSDSNDLVLSPLHGRIPGVYLHAMALDNLMNFGEDYARAMHLSFDVSNIKLLLFLVVAMVLVTLLPKQLMEWLGWSLARKPAGKHDWRGAARYLLSCVVRVLLSLAVGCLLLWIGQYWLGLGFLSIINVMVLTMLAEWFDFNEKLLDYIFPHHEAPEAH